MNDKDKDIQQLFDGYADSLETRPDLADAARDKLRAVSPAPKKRKTALWVSLASVGSAAMCALVVIAAVNLVGKVDNSLPSDQSPSEPDNPLPSVSYTINQVRAERVDTGFMENYIDMVGASAYGDVFAENYYACYLKDSETLVYVKAVFGVDTGYGNIEMSVIVENTGYERDDLKSKYSGYRKGEYTYRTEFVRGEYVTYAFYSDKDYRYYVSAMGNVDGAQNIARKLIGDKK